MSGMSSITFVVWDEQKIKQRLLKTQIIDQTIPSQNVSGSGTLATFNPLLAVIKFEGDGKDVTITLSVNGQQITLGPNEETAVIVSGGQLTISYNGTGTTPTIMIVGITVQQPLASVSIRKL